MGDIPHKTLIIEPFYGGSHAKMIRNLLRGVPWEDYTLITLPDKKWHWRARCSPIVILPMIPTNLSQYKTLFCSSVLPLAEMVGMCPRLHKLKKIVYFHENELVYPKQVIKKRDYQYGYNQITTCLAADVILFNSGYNRASFLQNIDKFLKMIPDFRSKDVRSMVSSKSRVIYYPIDYSRIDQIFAHRVRTELCGPDGQNQLTIAWAHRWEFDKNPEAFFETMYALSETGTSFQLIVMGQNFGRPMECFEEAKMRLAPHIRFFGYANTSEEYYHQLSNADIIVSTADHEFFGVSMMEGARLGCLPLVPFRLVYPELYPMNLCYKTYMDLFTRLKFFCENIPIFLLYRAKVLVNTDQFNVENIRPLFMKCLRE